MDEETNGDVSDEAIVTERFESLNQRFYSGDPAAYFRARIVGARRLLPRDEGADGSGEKFMQAVRFDDVALAKHIAVDAQVILHHASEAVLRFFFSHRNQPPCPWLELAGENKFANFKKLVSSWLEEPRLRDRRVAWVYLGSEDPPSDVNADAWAKATENATAFLKKFAAVWLNESNVYNSLKHGMAVSAGPSTFQIAADDSGSGFHRLADSMAVEYLEVEKWSDGRRTWSLTTQWIDAQEALDLAGAACRLLESAWNLAKWRYLDDKEEASIVVWLPDKSPVDMLRPKGVRHFRMKIIDEVKEGPV